MSSANNQSPKSISLELASAKRQRSEIVMIDVRKEPAYLENGQMVDGAVRCAPDDISNIATELVGKSVVVYCVHGHEVSQNASMILNDLGVDTAFLEGGFEAWQNADMPVQPIVKTGNEGSEQ